MDEDDLTGAADAVPGIGAGQDGARRLQAALTEEHLGMRLDKALALAIDPGAALSRSRLRGLIAEGQVRIDGALADDPGAKVKRPGAAVVTLGPPAPAEPAPEAIALSVIYEDADLIVVDKPAGMTVHPAPGSETGTLVNALLAHCGDSLSGVGGVARPGIVHRIDKDTSGLLVVAKNDAAHHALAEQFAAHDLERSYLAIARGAPSKADPRVMGLPSVTAEAGRLRIETEIARHKTDRKRMAVVSAGGKRAVTRITLQALYGPGDGAPQKRRAGEGRPWASLIECRLETGRTHQIRVHLSHIGAPLVGDPVYGAGRGGPTGNEAVDAALKSFPRQALHAATLGFRRPKTGELLRFSAPPPQDFTALMNALETETAR